MVLNFIAGKIADATRENIMINELYSLKIPRPTSITPILIIGTTYKIIWSLEGLSRILGIIVIIVLLFQVFYKLFNSFHNRSLWILYIIPGILISIGFIINFTRSVFLDIGTVSYFGLLVPWLIYLIMPSLVKFKKINVEYLWLYWATICPRHTAIGQSTHTYPTGTVESRAAQLALVKPNGVC